MTADDFVKWLHGFMAGMEAAGGGASSALQGIKAKLKEVVPNATSTISPPYPFIPPSTPSIVPSVQPLWVSGKTADWPKADDIVCQVGEVKGAAELQ